MTHRGRRIVKSPPSGLGAPDIAVLTGLTVSPGKKFAAPPLCIQEAPDATTV